MKTTKKEFLFTHWRHAPLVKKFFLLKSIFLKQLVLLVNGLLFLPQKNALF